MLVVLVALQIDWHQYISDLSERTHTKPVAILDMSLYLDFGHMGTYTYYIYMHMQCGLAYLFRGSGLLNNCVSSSSSSSTRSLCITVRQSAFVAGLA